MRINFVIEITFLFVYSTRQDEALRLFIIYVTQILWQRPRKSVVLGVNMCHFIVEKSASKPSLPRIHFKNYV